jgi:hypothetical protein
VHSRRQVLIAVCSIVVFAFVVRMLAWLAFPNQIWPDEIFQSLEQAHRVVFGYGVVPWEFREGTRSWLLPGMLTAVIAATSAITSSVAAYLAGCAALLSAISVAPIWATFRSALGDFGLRGAIVASGASATWFELVYFAPKALNEVVGGNLLVVGALLADRCVRASRGNGGAGTRLVIMTGSLLALASVLRIQLAIAAIAAFGYVFLRLTPSLRWRLLISGAVVVLVAGLLDWVTWNYPFQSFIENVRVNILVGRSKHYGTAPWYAYFEIYGRIWGIWSVLVVALAAIGARARPLLAVCAVAVLLAHIPVGHKEYRFAYPAMALVIALAGFGSASAVRWLEQKVTSRIASLGCAGLLTVWLAASLQCADGFHESKTRLALTYFQSRSHWALNRGALLATKDLGRDPTVCGIGLIGINVFFTGGYTYLHRPDVPFFETTKQEDILGLAPFVNVYVVRADLGATRSFGAFTQESCRDETCIYRRPGRCQIMRGYDFNKMLESRGL